MTWRRPISGRSSRGHSSAPVPSVACPSASLRRRWASPRHRSRNGSLASRHRSRCGLPSWSESSRLTPNALARHLGYSQGDEPGPKLVMTVVEAAEADPRLGEREQRILTAVYRVLVHQRASEQRDGERTTPAEPRPSSLVVTDSLLLAPATLCALRDCVLQSLHDNPSRSRLARSHVDHPHPPTERIRSRAWPSDRPTCLPCRNARGDSARTCAVDDSAGLTQQALAARIGYDRSYLSQVETGAQVPAEQFILLSEQELAAGGELLGMFRELLVEREARRQEAHAERWRANAGGG